MRITLPSFSINTEIFRETPSKEYLFLLHGFTGSSKDWRTIAEKVDGNFNIIGIDLPGHGSSDSPDNLSLYTAPAIVFQLHNIFKEFTLNKFSLLGYSMGGRAALAFAVNFPYLLNGLILESSSPGLKTESEKVKRIKKDSDLAQYINTHSIEEFVEYWMNLDIFNTQRRFSNEKREEIKQLKILNDKVGLVNSLIGFGTGVMPSYWGNLGEINTKTLLISGDLDPKYSEINSKMAGLLPAARHHIIKAAGHNTHLEEPIQFTLRVSEFMSSL